MRRGNRYRYLFGNKQAGRLVGQDLRDPEGRIWTVAAGTEDNEGIKFVLTSGADRKVVNMPTALAWRRNFEEKGNQDVG